MPRRPVDADEQARLEALSPERRALYLALRARKRQAETIVAGVGGRRALAAAQRRLWFLHTLAPERRDYLLAGRVRLLGALDREALARALTAVLERHELTRAHVVVGADGELELAIGEFVAVELEVFDRAPAWVLDPFELSRGPLVRFALVAAGPREHELLIVAHHLICDGASLSVFAEELSAHYRSLGECGRTATLAPLAISYTDFAAWEQRRLATGELDALERWWVAHLGEPPAPLFPARGSASVELVGERIGFEISSSLRASIDARAAALSTTRFAILTAALCAALFATHAREQLWIGTPVAGRERSEVRGLIGLFVNMIVIRARATERIGELVTGIRDELREVLAHAELPFDRLVERLRPKRELGGTPLLQAAISVQEAAPRFELGEQLVAELEPMFTGRVTIELLLVVRPSASGGLDASFEFAPERIDAVAVAGLIERYLVALEDCVSRPEQALERATAGERAGVCTNLTATQLAMWMGQRMHPDAPIYNQQMICRIAGAIDAGRLERAFARVVARHEALRSVVEVHDGVPRMRVLGRGAGRGVELEVIELERADEGTIAALIRRRGSRRFELAQGLVDGVLIRCGSECSVWVLTLHHLITDGRSFALILEQTAELYLADAESEVVVPIARSERPKPRLEQAREYWRGLEWPAMPRFFGQQRDADSTEVTRVRVRLDERRSLALRELCMRRELRGITPAVTLIHAFASLAAALVVRLSGERQLCIGVPLHNRGSLAAKRTVGALMIVCPLRIDVPAQASFAALARVISGTLREGLRNLDGLDAIRADRRPYDVLLNVLEVEPVALGGWPTEVELTTPGHALDGITINVEVRGCGFNVDLDLAASVFDEVRVAATRAELERLLDAMLEDFDGGIHGWSPGSASEEQAIASDEGSLWAEIVAASRGRADAIALEQGAAQVSFGGLLRRARAWAAGLARRGVGPGSLVGIALPRSPELVVAILATIACGGGYVPIDPCRPTARLREELEVIAGGLVVVEPEQRARLDALGVRVELLVIDDLDELGDTSKLELRACPSAPAYAMHTSGTGGRASAVLIQHRGLLNHARWARARFGLRADDRVLQFADLGFDTAAEEIVATLLAGATLVLREPATLDAPAAFWRRCRVAGISVIDLPTAYWHVLTAEGSLDASALGCVRLVVIGGERAERHEVERWLAAIGERVELLNTYGPTEATIVSTAYTARVDSLAGGRELPIGRAIPNVRADVIALADYPARAMPEVPGELYIGGVGVASGYVGRARLTASRFVPDPHGRAGARLYRTGDRVRLGRDGELEFLGRLDRQLKLHGVRIEPVELERALLARPEVQAVAVVATGLGRAGAARLWAFMVASVDSPPEPSVIVAGLAPSGVTLRGEWIDALPLTARGKLDFDVLRERAEARAAGSGEAVDAGGSTDIASTLRNLWAELLEREVAELDEHADFFELGGHSLLGAMLMARIERRFDVELPLRELFERPQLGALAQAIADAQQRGDSRSQTPALVATPNRGARIRMSAAQERLWFLDQLDPGNPTYNVPAAVELLGKLEPEQLGVAITEVVRRHEALRTTFELDGADPVQVINPAAPVPITVIALEHLAAREQDAEVERRARAHAALRFDLERGPLLAIELLRLGPGRHVLLLDVHHIVADGWSVGILVRELWTLLAALRERGRIDDVLPPLAIQYADYAIWQRARLRGPEAARERSWWRAALADAPETVALPCDRPRPAIERHVGARRSIRFEAALVERVATLARSCETTPYVCMLACYATLLARLSRATELCVGTPVAGREDPATEGLIGFFVNTVVLRLRLDGDPRFRELVRRVRATCLDALGHRMTPFEDVVEQLRPQRSLARQPLFQVMFTFLNEPTRRELDGPSPLAWRVLDFDRNTANRDLTLRLEARTEGLVGHLEYNTDLFDAETIEGWATELDALVRAVLDDPDARLSSLARVEPTIADSRHRKFAAARGPARPRPSAPAELFTIRPLHEDRRGPVVLEPRSRDLDPHAWLGAEGERVAALAREHGGVLLRDLPIDSPDQLGRLCRLVTPTLMRYDEQSTPRTTVGDHIYTSTEYPAEHRIMPHNEMAYASRWPRWIWFFCRVPAPLGGESPLADGARVYAAIDPGLRAQFEARGVCYMRNYRAHLDLPWQRVFGTDDRAQLEAHFERVGTRFEWSADGGLRTWDRTPAIARARPGGPSLWFNSAHMFHVQALEPEVRASLRALFADEALPRHARFGDGSAIEDDAIDHIREIYRRESSCFGWRRGDLLLLDNVRFAHGREPFSGAREILVAMAEPSSDRHLAEEPT